MSQSPHPQSWLRSTTGLSAWSLPRMPRPLLPPTLALPLRLLHRRPPSHWASPSPRQRRVRLCCLPTLSSPPSPPSLLRASTIPSILFPLPRSALSSLSSLP
eukprot:2854734-Rhodomonas_salina.1